MESTVNPNSEPDTTLAGRASGRSFGALAAEVDAAGYYDDIFVPALFAQWVEPLARAAVVRPGERVLDVACGSGVVARDLVSRLDPAPLLSGLDLAPGMLEVAARRAPDVEWRQGNADALPWPDGYFDRVLCQYGLMFFDDPVRAIREMCRVLAPGGRIALAVWDSLEHNPGFARKVEILERMAGPAAADALRAPFALGARETLLQFARQAGMVDVELQSREGSARFGSLREFVDAELRGWLPVMGVNLDDGLIDAIYRQCEREFGAWLGPDRLVMPVQALLLSGGAAQG